MKEFSGGLSLKEVYMECIWSVFGSILTLLECLLYGYSHIFEEKNDIRILRGNASDQSFLVVELKTVGGNSLEIISKKEMKKEKNSWMIRVNFTTRSHLFWRSYPFPQNTHFPVLCDNVRIS